MNEISILNDNTEIVLTIYTDSGLGTVKDLTDATSISYRIKRPDETVISRTGALKNSGSDGKVTYTMVNADLITDPIGLYDVQVYVESDDWSGQSSSYQFTTRETNLAT